VASAYTLKVTAIYSIYIYMCVCVYNSESQVEIKDQCVAHNFDDFGEILPKYVSQIPMQVKYKSLEKENECCKKR
jgi:hypothetical protein